MRIQIGKRGHVVEIDEEDWTKPIRLCDLPWAIMQTRGGTDYVTANVLLHRAVMDFPDGPVDHIDRSGLNCSRSNLRAVTVSQNQWNRRFQKRGTSSRYWGVCYLRASDSWVARIGSDNKKIHIGSFKTEREAALAYNAKCLELRGPEFAVLNPIPDDDPCAA